MSLATAGAWRSLSRLARFAADALYPPLCPLCDAALSEPDGLCAKCWRGLRPITKPLCPKLGVPFSVPLGPDALSAEAIADPPPFERARSAVLYNETARQLVGRLKYGDRPELARLCARLMRSAGAELLDERPLIVPVPLHWRRHWQRRYNQSAELGRALAQFARLPFDPDLLDRRRATPRQVGLSATARRANLAGAFVARPQAAAQLAGRRVLLVDDVITTGTTVRMATKALLTAGAGAVDVLSFARVVLGVDGA